MKKLLITGISGFLGWHISRLEQHEWQIFGTYNKNKAELPGGVAIEMDLTDTEKVATVIAAIQPDAILHMAALSNPNFCEENPQFSQAINVKGSILLAKYALDRDIPFFFISTDLVFDGQKGNYSEENQPSPINRYGLHKAVAESKILALYKKATIVRLPLMYGITDNQQNFLSNWLNHWMEGKTIPAFSDEFRSPISANDAARGLFFLLEEAPKGIWHLAGSERISRYDFALKMAEIFDFSPDLVTESLQSEVEMPAARPSDVSMQIEKLMEAGYSPQKIEDNLKQIKLSIDSLLT